MTVCFIIQFLNEHLSAMVTGHLSYLNVDNVGSISGKIVPLTHTFNSSEQERTFNQDFLLFKKLIINW